MSLDLVCENILDVNSISKSNLENFIFDLSCIGSDYGDIYFQKKSSEFIFLENGLLKNNVFDILEGVGVRVISDDKIGFSCTNDISLSSISKCIKKSVNIFGKKIVLKNNILNLNKNNYKISVYNSELFIDIKFNKNKIDFLYDLYYFIKKMDNRINYVSLSLLSSFDYILILSTDNFLVSDIRPLIKLSIKVQVEDCSGNREIGFSGGGGRYSYNVLLNKKYNNVFIYEYWATEAVRIAINNLKAYYAPAGIFPVILGSGCTGILFHEAVGHCLEGDFNRKGISSFKDYIGTIVASKNFNLVDDGTIFQNRGSLNIDDEGTLTKKNFLIKNGVLVSYMLDKFNAKLMGLNTTGNARRQSYEYLPIPRMTNTYLLPGSFNFLDILSTVSYGLYIVSLGSGQVDITSGKFVFTVLEGYLIKNGNINVPVKGVTLIGSGIEILSKISMIGNDLNFDNGLGTCFKDGQEVPVCVGQPSLKIDSMVIGGIN